jgi:outer membrane lipoprotein LolB
LFSRLISSPDRRARGTRAAARLGPACAALLLAGCAAAPPLDGEQRLRAPLYEQRVAWLSQVDSWALQGRLAVSDEAEGGSGSFSWRQEGGSSRMDFHGALGRGAWRLVADANGAELEFADGTLYRAASVDSLVRGQIGWAVPVESLAWWVRGLAAPGEVQQRLLDEEGRLSELRQNGWSIEFGRYGQAGVSNGAHGALTLPLRMTARQADRAVKLVVRKWELPGENDATN